MIRAQNYVASPNKFVQANDRIVQEGLDKGIITQMDLFTQDDINEVLNINEEEEKAAPVLVDLLYYNTL